MLAAARGESNRATMAKKAEAKKEQAKVAEKQTAGVVDVATGVEMWAVSKVKPYKRNALIVTGGCFMCVA